MALITLEIGFAVNLLNLCGWWTYVFPNSATAYDTGALTEAFGAGWWIEVYFVVRNYIVHTIPFVFTVLNILSADIIFLESNWWLMPTTAALYFICNFLVGQY